MLHTLDHPISRIGTHSVKWERYRDTRVIPMWVADMDLPVASQIQEAVRSRTGHPIFGYTAPSPELVTAVCQALRREYAWEIDPRWIVWLPGTLPGVSAGCRAFSEKGDEILFTTPAFSEFFRMVRLSGRTALTVPMTRAEGRWTLDLSRLRESITPRTKVMLLCSPNNPTGTVFTIEELQALGELCAEKGLIILSDEVHSGLVLAPGKHHVPTAIACPANADSLVTLMSPSKTYNLGGLNCAYAIIQNEALKSRFIAECEGFGIMPAASALPYVAAVAAYRDSDKWHQGVLSYLWDNYLYLEDRIARVESIEITPLEATYLAWLDVSALKLPKPAEFFEVHGVGMSCGDSFGAPGFLRMNFACPRNTLKTALDRIEAAIGTLRAGEKPIATGAYQD